MFSFTQATQSLLLLSFLLSSSFQTFSQGSRAYIAEGKPRGNYSYKHYYQQRAQSEDKLLLFVFVNKLNYYSRSLEKELQETELQKFLYENYLPNYINLLSIRPAHRKLIDAFHIKTSPTMVVVDENWRTIHSITGFRTHDFLLSSLKSCIRSQKPILDQSISFREVNTSPWVSERPNIGSDHHIERNGIVVHVGQDYVRAKENADFWQIVWAHRVWLHQNEESEYMLILEVNGNKKQTQHIRTKMQENGLLCYSLQFVPESDNYRIIK